MRINCIPVQHLTDQHLRAEWVETLMLPAYLRRSLKAGCKFSDSKIYVLNTGHARFFYNKLGYVQKRYQELEIEMKRRGFRVIPILNLTEFPESLFADWLPTREDMINNLHRILTRIDAKPEWYSYEKTKVTDWHKFYKNIFPFYEYVFRETDIKKSNKNNI